MTNLRTHPDKQVALSELPGLVPPGSTIGLGGAWMANHPMAAVRELLRARVGDLRLIGSLSSIDVDLLIGAGLVSELTFSMVSLEAYGLAPAFRRAAQENAITLHEVSGVAMNVALDAGAHQLPYLPMRDIGGSQLVEVSADHYHPVTCPFTGESLLAIRAINPDIALIHVRRADRSGNCQVDGPLANDPELARAARRVIVTCEQIVDRVEIASAPATTHIPGFLVEAVIEAPFGAHPTSHVPAYGFDAWAVMDYADAWQAGDGDAYLDALAAEDEAGYRARVLDDERRDVLCAIAATSPTLDEEGAA